MEAEAAVVASALREAGAVVGGHGRPGDDVRALAHLATLLPGWGEEELAARGAALAAQLGDFDGDPELEGIQDRMAHAARAALPLSGTPAFADAVLARLGVDGVRDLLTALGRAADPATSPVAALLASVLGVASSGGPSWAVVDAPYAGAQGVSVDLTVAGMTAVLAAGAVPGARGLRPATVALWTRQFLLLDKAEGRRVGERVTYRWSSELADPVAVGMGVLARSGAPHVVAGLLEEAAVWTEALSRWWRDGGDAFGELVHQLRLDDSSTGARAVRVALEVIGSGLTPGDLSARTVRRDTVDAVSSSLAHAVAAHVPVAVEALSVGVDGLLRNGGAPLRALGYLSVGSGGAAAMQEAILDWSRDRPVEPGDASSFSPAPAVAIPAAYMAAREYGQRLDHALDAYEIKEEAEAEAERWDKTFGLLGFLPGPWGLVGGVAEGSAAIALGMDGRFDAGVDRGLRFDADDAVDVASAATSPDRSVDLAALDEQARAAFARTGRALGDVAAPVSEESDLAAVFADGLRGLAQERVVRALKLLRGGD
ncbi:hypothetical protein [Blastococcus sp. PRF04-17]|uniref:hypothetical protein n=1 Tax=Blastococcus sp. PRF04-17 TaxID=2933797 RepID=UPI001FF3E19A|nr:hypothetical protein [Blastococcus sp. PRF04-17]UOY01021.1 hypothetical protein MVA48_18915 [Blastococcus sp. PRF04-17]